MPLPSQTKSVYTCHLEVMTCSANGKLESLLSNQGFAGCRAGAAYLCTGVEDQETNQNRYPELKARFDHLIRVAKGESSPS